MNDLVMIGFILIAAVTLDVTAVLFGFDSREGFADARNDFSVQSTWEGL